MFSLPRLTPQQQAATDAKLWQQRESERLQQQAAQDAEDLEWDRVSEKRKLREQDPIAQRPAKVGGQAFCHTLKTQQRAEAAEQVEARAAEEPLPNSVELTKATTTTTPATTEDDPSPASTGKQFRLALIHSPSKPEWATARHVIQYIAYYITNECPQTRVRQYEWWALAHNAMHLSDWTTLFPKTNIEMMTHTQQEFLELLNYYQADGNKLFELGVRPEDIIEDEDEHTQEDEHSQDHDDSQEDEHTSEDE